MSDQQTKLSSREKVGYGLGDTASNIFFFGVNAWIFFYYTEICKIPPATVGTLLLVPRLWDAISDPLMGTLSDRTRTKMGTYRPYLLWLAIPFGICGYLTFANPDFSLNGKIIYAYITYIALMTAYTAINVPYSALMGVMTPSPDERTKLATYRFVGAFSGQLLISMTFLPLVMSLGGDDKGVGFPRAMALLAVVATLMFLITFFTTKERVKPPEIDKSPKPNEDEDYSGPFSASSDGRSSFGWDFGSLLNNRPWVVMVAAALLTLTAAAVRWTITPQHLKYFFGVGDEKYFLFLDKISFVQTTGSLAFIAGVFLTGFFSKRFGKRNSLIGLTILNGLTILSIYLIPQDGYTTLVIVNIIGSLIAGPTPALVWAMYTDVADYNEWKTGRRATGLAFSAAMFSQKLGISIGGALCGWVLGAVGFVPDKTPSEEVVNSFRWIASLLPGILAILNGFVLLGYNLSDAKVERIAKDLAEGRGEGDE
ncbi:MFS transporter [Akkermansiaceae bacterium]|nr:MFS transporter [Akkermansiaceae bacterium]MDB4317872.1 MFS transporter [bacterium]MDA7629527.1 MFS transporter [Akkermansiaceae bacterium]MDA7648905.1 MFS transporter [Akkermansiaceae bacterium]MDB4040969.1 MFS transporter [Akkermansiaceae bacterium]